ncbi:hypothetical protein CPB84DRAFT_1820841 [Gymnopilus junonius]|uniref:Uncharacterized protein n=1 Tax=Gymnopilus junonius TaxID=109634 RepID=A0A9P5TUW1_GYMJU|nr:hypothetical protein CPB84DRAFT_1820841 [Gymnopilus junonius]
MNSPPDPGSPSPSTPSSGSPPPEEVNFQPVNAGRSYIENLTSQISTAFTGGSSSSKRRLPTGPFGRDAKTRRRGEASRQNTTSAIWDGIKEPTGGKKDKDELIDPALVEYLRKVCMFTASPKIAHVVSERNVDHWPIFILPIGST